MAWSCTPLALLPARTSPLPFALVLLEPSRALDVATWGAADSLEAPYASLAPYGLLEYPKAAAASVSTGTSTAIARPCTSSCTDLAPACSCQVCARYGLAEYSDVMDIGLADAELVLCW